MRATRRKALLFNRASGVTPLTWVARGVTPRSWFPDFGGGTIKREAV